MSHFKKSVVSSCMQIGITGGNLLFAIVVARLFGTLPEMDAYVVVANFLMLVMALLYALHQKSLMPFLGAIEDEDERMRAFSSIARFNNVVSLGGALLMLVASSQLVYILAPGLPLEQRALATRIMRLASGIIVLSNVQGMAKAHIELHGKAYFSQSLELVRVGLLLGLLFFLSDRLQIFVLPFANIMALFVGVVVVGFVYSWTPFTLLGKGPLITPSVKKYLVLVLPVLVGQIMMWLIRISDTFLASFLSQGVLSQMSYALKIINNFSQLFVGVYIVYLPLLATLQAEKDNKKHANITLEGFSHLLFATLSVVVFVTVWAPEVIQVLFERGNFTSYDTQEVAKLLQFYCYMLLGSQLGGYLSSVYYARQLTKRATVYSIISSVVNVVLNFVLVFKFKAIGLALASSIAFFVGNVLQVYNLPLVNPELTRIKLYKIIARVSGPVFLSAGVMFLVKWFWQSQYPLVSLTLFGSGYFGGVLIIGALFKVPTAELIFKKLRIIKK